ncbi:MAG: hypothetical protein U5K28_02235 [Halobacteriales archaeon]|nr:hypothetical protein [Halobacteriales archaeon]
MNETDRETFDAVVEALDTWNPYHAQTGLSQLARQYLERTLNDGRSRRDRRRIKRGSGGLAVDLVVDETVAIVLLESPNGYNGRQVAARLKSISERFPYLVTYWWNNNSFDSNSHRALNRRHTPSTLGVRDLAQLSRDNAPAKPHTRLTRQLITRSGFFALVALASAITLAVGISVSPLETTLTRGLFVATGMLFIFATSMAAALAVD